MKIDDKVIDHLAHLSRLDFTGEAKEEIKKDMNRILEFVGKLSELDTEGIDPLVYLTDEVNVLRKDISQIEITHQEALKNAPDKDSDYFRVPKMVDRSKSDQADLLGSK